MSSIGRAATPRAEGGAGERGREEILSLRGVAVALGGRQVLEDVSFSIGAGEFTGLIGANGSGKTTLLRVILGLQAPGAGSVHVAGRRQRLGHVRDRARIGYVPQKFAFDPEMPLRARDLVALGIDGHRLGVALPSRRRASRVEQMLASVDALELADARIGSLSGGEQQRVLIAHALVSEPRLLLLDEPLANLDLASAHGVVQLLAAIAARQEIAILISAHEMNPLLPVLDRVVYLAGGRAASGSTGEVVRADVLSRLYGRHVDVLHVHGRVLVVAGAGDDADLEGHEGGVHHGVRPLGATEADRAGRGEALP